MRKFETRITVEYGTIALSYKELSQLSNDIANRIITKGLKQGTIIGLLMEDRLSLIISLLGILNAGCVFVILDPALPQSRLEYMVQSIDMPFIFTDIPNRNFVSDSSVLKSGELELTVIDDWLTDAASPAFSEPPAIEYQAEDKIYIYFTSGSTGKPKAIIGKNISLLHFIQWEIDTLAIDETVNVSQLIAPGFDAFLRDFFVPLLTGGRLCIPFDPDTKLNARQLVQWLERSRVNLLHCVPALFRQLEPSYANIKYFRYLRYVLLSGEKINVSDLTVWFDDSTPLKDSVKILNLYGPTETTMTKTWHVIESEDLQRPRIPVGKPMRGVGIMVLDDNMN
ncbi:MAG: amino acid adenylation domain-containing protein, partial [bacterium]|nr:amino acid adenylation domain-containing protein [bacterium]